VTNPADREVVEIVTMGDHLGHPFAMAPGVPPKRLAAVRKAFAEMLKDPDFLKEAAAAKLDVNPVSASALQTAVSEALNASSEAKTRARKYFR
jgi:hypothetical protein